MAGTCHFARSFGEISCVVFICLCNPSCDKCHACNHEQDAGTCGPVKGFTEDQNEKKCDRFYRHGSQYRMGKHSRATWPVQRHRARKPHRIDLSRAKRASCSRLPTDLQGRGTSSGGIMAILTSKPAEAFGRYQAPRSTISSGRPVFSPVALYGTNQRPFNRLEVGFLLCGDHLYRN